MVAAQAKTGFVVWVQHIPTGEWTEISRHDTIDQARTASTTSRAWRTRIRPAGTAPSDPWPAGDAALQPPRPTEYHVWHRPDLHSDWQDVATAPTLKEARDIMVARRLVGEVKIRPGAHSPAYPWPEGVPTT